MNDTATPTLAELIDAKIAQLAQSPWVPACGGTEVEFTARSGHRLLYMYQPATGRHAYLDVGADIFLTDTEASAILG